jgi:hypothetical protein
VALTIAVSPLRLVSLPFGGENMKPKSPKKQFGLTPCKKVIEDNVTNVSISNLLSHFNGSTN